MVQLVDGAILMILNGTITIPAIMNEDVGAASASVKSKFSDLTEFSPPYQKDIGSRQKAIQGVRVELDQIPTQYMRVSLYTKDRLNGAETKTGPFSLIDYAGDGVVWMKPPEARYIAVEVEDLAPSSIWNVTAIEYYGFTRGGKQ